MDQRSEVKNNSDMRDSQPDLSDTNISGNISALIDIFKSPQIDTLKTAVRQYNNGQAKEAGVGIVRTLLKKFAYDDFYVVVQTGVDGLSIRIYDEAVTLHDSSKVNDGEVTVHTRRRAFAKLVERYDLTEIDPATFSQNIENAVNSAKTGHLPFVGLARGDDIV